MRSNVIQYSGNHGQAVTPHTPGAPRPEFWEEAVQPNESSLVSRLRRRKAWLITTTLATATVVAGVYYITPKTYRAVGSVAITTSSGDSIISPQNPQAVEKLGDAADMESQLLMLRSPTLLHKILTDKPEIVTALMRECQLSHHTLKAELMSHIRTTKPCEDGLADQDAQVEALSNAYDIAAAGRSRVITVSYTSQDPTIAKLMVNTLIEAYVEQGTAEKLRTRSQAAQWIQSELVRLQGELRDGEAKIEAYRREHGLIKGSTGSIQSESLSSISQQLAIAQAQRSQALAALEQVNKGTGVSTMRDVTASATITGLRTQQAAAQARLATLSSQYGPNNPQVMAARKEVGDIGAAIGGEIGRVRSGLQQAYSAADQQVKELESQMTRLKGEVGTASDAESAMATMQRDVEVRRSLYVDMSTKAAALETERRLVSGDVKIVSRADKPSLPWFPKLMPFVAGGGILAIIMGVGAAVLRDKADKTVRATVKLEYATGYPVLGHIPAAGKFKASKLSFSRKSRALITTHPQLDKPSALQESIRSLYAQVLLMNADIRSVMIASSNSGEGKTFLSLALAQFAAQAGKKVLAIEADMRRPTFAQRFRLRGKVGLVDLLRGHAEIDEAVQETSIAGLSMITAGRPAIDSTELLNNGKMRTIMEQVKTEYDLVLVDSPPSEVLVDSRILAPMVDGILYCAKWGETENQSIARGIKMLQTVGGEILGMVLGQVKAGEYRLYETRHTHVTGPYMIEGNA
jgi:capsular exopolysaccharide synthesis family protein